MSGTRTLRQSAILRSFVASGGCTVQGHGGRRRPVALPPRLSLGVPFSREGATDLESGTEAVKHRGQGFFPWNSSHRPSPRVQWFGVRIHPTNQPLSASWVTGREGPGKCVPSIPH
jgi:hypothetical protein